MQPVVGTGAALLPATAALAALAALSCTTTSAPPQAPAPELVEGARLPEAAECRRYAENADVWRYCMVKQARDFRKPADVERLCPLTGDREPLCRQNWMIGHLAPHLGFSTQELLGICGDAQDCKFELLDQRPSDRVLEQVDLCVDHAGRHTKDCVGHAMERWARTRPDVDEFLRIGAQERPYAPLVGSFLGEVVACQGVGACDVVHGSMKERCDRRLRELTASPERCDRGLGAPHGPPGGR